MIWKIPLLLVSQVLLAASHVLSGCASVDVEEYKRETPELVMENYFNGALEAWGMFVDRRGAVKQRFHVSMDASWTDDTGILDEHFVYSDGRTQRRTWSLQRLAPGRYRGTADDVVGDAQGTVSGNALHWRYRLDLEADGKTYRVDFDDWMYLQEGGVLINRSVMSKFGFRLGEVILFFRKLS